MTLEEHNGSNLSTTEGSIDGDPLTSVIGQAWLEPFQGNSAYPKLLIQTCQ